MKGLGLVFYGAVILSIGLLFLIKPNYVVKLFYAIPEKIKPAAVVLIQITGLVALFIFIIFLCGLWANYG
jgi:hypothetical protein